jgi:hypothetical protein
MPRDFLGKISPTYYCWLEQERTITPVQDGSWTVVEFKCDKCGWRSGKPTDLHPETLRSVFAEFDEHDCNAFRRAR